MWIGRPKAFPRPLKQMYFSAGEQSTFRSVEQMTKPARFSQADIARAAKGMEKAGLRVAGAKIDPDGSITVLIEPQATANDRVNPLDRLHQHG